MDIKVCDICAKQGILIESKRSRIPVGHSTCPAGGSSEADVEYLDLCDKHFRAVIVPILKDLPYDLGRRVYEQFLDLSDLSKKE